MLPRHRFHCFGKNPPPVGKSAFAWPSGRPEAPRSLCGEACSPCIPGILGLQGLGLGFLKALNAIPFYTCVLILLSRRWPFFLKRLPKHFRVHLRQTSCGRPECPATHGLVRHVHCKPRDTSTKSVQTKNLQQKLSGCKRTGRELKL